MIRIQMAVELRRPAPELAKSFAEMRDAFLAIGDDRWSPPNNLAEVTFAHTDVLRYIDLLNDWAKGKNLPEGWVPSSEFWIVKDGIVIGSVGIRHHLNDQLRRVGGHVGYDVHPAHRNQGIATFALKKALSILALMGEREALVTCNVDNLASARVAEKCGGVRIADSIARNGSVRRRYLLSTAIPNVIPGAMFIGGAEPVAIIIAKYDPAWPRRFEAERSRIADALSGSARSIDHIGSTAVPGLAAKPIIDVMIAVDDVEDETAYLCQLERAGYMLRVREPGHRMLRTTDKQVHVHVWSAAADIERHIAFRDRLRESEHDRRLYEGVKRELAERTWNDSNEYAAAKRDIIAEILAAATSSSPVDVSAHD